MTDNTNQDDLDAVVGRVENALRGAALAEADTFVALEKWEGIVATSIETADLRALLAALREALEKYGDHEPECPRSVVQFLKGENGFTCTCGLSRALEES